jgi:hypothetical protein
MSDEDKKLKAEWTVHDGSADDFSAEAAEALATALVEESLKVDAEEVKQESYEPHPDDCPLCKQRGKRWSGSDPECAFRSGVFSGDNWNCATMSCLRDVAEKLGLCWRNDDSAGSIGYVPAEEGYIVMTWYKNRGQTGNALVVCDDQEHAPLSLEVAEDTLERWDKRLVDEEAIRQWRAARIGGDDE